jgi:hypothetical protein
MFGSSWRLSLAVLVGCGGAASTATPTTEDGGVVAEAGAPDAPGTDAPATTAYTLATCPTDVGADVPAFYRRYFKCLTIKTTADGIRISWNGLPPHLSYYYGEGSPNYVAFDVSRGAQYQPNPNKIASRAHAMTVPNTPVSRGLTIDTAMVDRTANTSPSEYRGGPVGVAIDSVSIFNDQAAPGDNIDNERYTFDAYEAHPTQNGDYHYHAASPGPLEVLKSLGLVTTTTPGEAGLEVYGIMCDGTVVLGCTELDGSAPPASGLDAQNGHVGDLRDKDGVTHFTARYHTHVCPKLFTTHRYMPEIQYYGACTLN